QIKSYTDSSPKRLLLWKTWLSQKNFSPRLKILTHIFSQKSMKMQIFLAYQDELCPEKPIKQFASKHTNVTLIEMPYKHHRILQEVLKDYRFAQFLG
ncbi:MAG: hypothetical protein RMJ97_11545, partial [Raineya sp.]|nr:hypothetical protein [Raineya sp.]